MTDDNSSTGEWVRRTLIPVRVPFIIPLAVILSAVVFGGCRFAGSSPEQLNGDQAKSPTGDNGSSGIVQVGESRDESSGGPLLRERLANLPHPLKNLVRLRKGAAPHLGEVYSRAAQFHDGHRNPVIVIPGILGSRLTDSESGRVLWGQAGFRAANPARANDARLLALPIDPNRSLRMLTDSDIVEAILGDVEFNLFGIPLQVHAYRGVLSSLGVGGYRNDSSGRATLDSVSYGADHYTCFEFHYDWRRDNSENAAALGRFIKEKADYVREVRKNRFGVEGVPVRFDVVAHSMGGLIARYFLRYGDQPLAEGGSLPELNWAGASDIETLILVGTPNAGAADSLQNLVEGIKYSPVLPKYPAAILGTMPAIYQLLPRPRHSAVVDAETGRSIDLYDWEQWWRFRWGLLDPKEDSQLKKLLPEVATRAEREAMAADHLRKSLNQAKRFHQVLDIPAAPPSGTSIYLIAGDAKDTISSLKVNPQNGRLKVAGHAAGDATVLRSSAMMDERLDPQVGWSPRLISPIAWRHTTFLFTDHLGLTSDPAFTDNVLYLLLESPR